MKRLLWIVVMAAALFSAAEERVASLSPNLTETIVRLGAEKQLVGRSESCDYPPDVKQIPVVGRFGVPSLEPLLAARPTLVVSETLRDPAAAERLRELNIRCELFPARTFEEYFSTLERLGKLLGKESEAHREITAGCARIIRWEQANRSTPPDKRPRVLVIIGVSPVVTAGKQSFLTRMIELAGGRNCAAEVDRNYFRCSFEQIQLWQPEVILAPGLPSTQVRTLEQSPGWSSLPAVRNQRILTDIDADLLYRLGPRSFDGIELLREKLKPRE